MSEYVKEIEKMRDMLLTEIKNSDELLNERVFIPDSDSYIKGSRNEKSLVVSRLNKILGKLYKRDKCSSYPSETLEKINEFVDSNVKVSKFLLDLNDGDFDKGSYSAWKCMQAIIDADEREMW